METELVFKVGTEDSKWYVFTDHTPEDGVPSEYQRYYHKIWAQHLPSEEFANKIAFILQTELNNSH
jgi:hypothetical protein